MSLSTKVAIGTVAGLIIVGAILGPSLYFGMNRKSYISLFLEMHRYSEVFEVKFFRPYNVPFKFNDRK